jgi:hypothetical protein
LCDCLPEFEGVQCEFTIGEPCGGMACQNGASCVEITGSEMARQGGLDYYFCDCTAASTESAFFAGRLCQYESTATCDRQDNSPNGPRFCVNGGGCLDESKGRCECPGGFFGSRCEFTQEDLEAGYTTCSLSCLNGGTCAYGLKVLAPVFEPFADSVTSLFDETGLGFEHCLCPPGYFGVRCEYEYSLCGEGEHICFHGSSCTEVDDGWQCDCSEAFAAGLYCQYLATVVCDASTNSSFCTNGGTCTNESGR